MSNLATLKKKAAEFEQKRQFDRALEAYEEVLRLQDGTEDADVALYNRVGDMQLRQGRTQEALRSYERAVDLYSDRGFLNNAIALCNKILRQDPLRAPVHFKLGRAAAVKGFRSDARQHFLEYAGLMERAGRLDDAFAALAGVADATPDNDDLRLLLAEQLERHGRTADAVAQLQRVADLCDRAGRPADASTARERIRTLDPEYAGGDGGSAAAEFGHELVPTGASAAGRMPELVLIEPSEFAGERSRTPAGGAPAAGVSVAPLEIMRGADVELGADAGFGAAEAGDYSIADLEPTAFAGASDVAPLDGGEIHDAGILGSALDVVEPVDERTADARYDAASDLALYVSEDAEDVDDDALGSADLTFIDTGLAPSAPARPDARVAAARASVATGDVEGALRELDHAVHELDEVGEFAAADAAIEELLELAPGSLALHERRVARAGRGGSRRVVLANLELARAARAAGDEPRARDAYERALALDPSNDEARDGAQPGASRPDVTRAVRPAMPTPAMQRAGFPTPNAVRPVPATPISSRPVTDPSGAAAGFVDLGELLRDDDGPRSTRMVTEERAPSGDEQADFAVMLRKFTQGVSEHVDAEDFDSHYDLGVAYKEMGLVDEAIAAFQRALRGTVHRARTYEALGQCFLERGQHTVASAVLQRATQEGGLADEQLVGVYYLLGRTAEAMNQRDEALRYYERVLAVDITFSDVADRMGLASQVPR